MERVTVAVLSAPVLAATVIVSSALVPLAGLTVTQLSEDAAVHSTFEVTVILALVLYVVSEKCTRFSFKSIPEKYASKITKVCL